MPLKAAPAVGAICTSDIASVVGVLVAVAMVPASSLMATLIVSPLASGKVKLPPTANTCVAAS